jgi:hypothetical protein
MSFTEHLAFADIRCTTFAPSTNMIGIHLIQFPYAIFVAV